MMSLENVTLNPASIVPLYKQVSSYLTETIKKGDLAVGDKLPSELTLMKLFSVSRITIRAAIAEMVDEGLLERSQGKGTFVAKQKNIQSANDLMGLSESCQRSGKSIRTKVLSMGYAYPTRSESEFLHIPDTEQIIETIRLRFIDDQPTVIETVHLLSKYDFLTTDDISGSLFSTLRRHGIVISNNKRTLEIAYANANEAELLNVKRNSPLLLFRDYQADQNGMPIYISKQLYTMQNMLFYL